MTKTTRIPLNGQVLCDGCNEDYTTSDLSGGLLFCSYAYCPTCTPRMLESIAKYGEEEFIKGRCPEGKSFADWVRQDLRGDDPDADAIVITSTDLRRLP